MHNRGIPSSYNLSARPYVVASRVWRLDTHEAVLECARATFISQIPKQVHLHHNSRLVKFYLKARASCVESPMSVQCALLLNRIVNLRHSLIDAWLSLFCSMQLIQDCRSRRRAARAQVVL